MIIDSHCHLDRLNLEQCGGSLDAAIAAARNRGVGHMLCVCISEANKDTILGIASQHDDISASVGVHPSDVDAEVVAVEQLLEWSQHPEVVALGETGLDYYYSADSRDTQCESFNNHLIAGEKTHLPVIVHTRSAKDDTLECIRRHAGPAAGVLHCFTESWEMASAAMDYGFYVSISGIVTFRNAEALREVVKRMPLDRLLVETDSPYLAPVPYRGKSNQPQYVREVAEYVAELKNIRYEELAEKTTENFYSLFPRAQSKQSNQ